MQGTKLLLGLLLFWGLYSCGKSTLVASDYVSWVNDPTNGLLKHKMITPLEVELLYKPIPYIIANEQRTNEINKEAYEARFKKLEGLQYYTLKLSIVGQEQDVTNFQVMDQTQQQDRLAYLSFAMQEDIKLVEGNDTLPCVLYHFERSYDVTAFRTFVLAFEQRATHKEEDKTLVLDLAYFKTGPIKINYNRSDLSQIPNLKLKNQ